VHRHFANSRSYGQSSVYVEDDTSQVALQLHAYCDSSIAEGDSTLPLVVTGAAGVGKSSILANFTKQRDANNLPTRGLGYKEFVYYHCIGCSRLSTSILPLLRRLINALINHFELKEHLDLSDEKLAWILPRVIDRASRKGKVVIIIDGNLHHICTQDVRWLPLVLPANARMIISVVTPCANPPQISDYATKLQCKIVRVWQEIQRRRYPIIRVNQSETLVTSIVEKYLPMTSNRDLILNQIKSHECTKNALFLATALKGANHLTNCLGYKSHEVARCLTIWMSSNTSDIHGLIESMLTVFEFGPEAAPKRNVDISNVTELGVLLSHSLSLLFVSRHGLREDELLELVKRVRENERWKNQTKDTVIPIKLKLLKSIMQKKNRLLDIFRSFDTDGNGYLDRAEFYNGIKRLSLEVTHDEVTLLIDEVDNNGDGEIGK
jgi:hypothetical protein